MKKYKMPLKQRFRIFLGYIWFDYCTNCGSKLVEEGYNFRMFCPHCSSLERFDIKL